MSRSCTALSLLLQVFVERSKALQVRHAGLLLRLHRKRQHPAEILVLDKCRTARRGLRWLKFEDMIARGDTR